MVGFISCSWIMCSITIWVVIKVKRGISFITRRCIDENEKLLAAILLQNLRPRGIVEDLPSLSQGVFGGWSGRILSRVWIWKPSLHLLLYLHHLHHLLFLLHLLQPFHHFLAPTPQNCASSTAWTGALSPSHLRKCRWKQKNNELPKRGTQSWFEEPKVGDGVTFPL